MIILEPKSHTYTDEDNELYISANQLLKFYESEFDPYGEIAKAVARKRQLPVEDILKEWEDKRISASTMGIKTHSVIQTYLETGIVDIENKALIDTFKKIKFKGKLECEVILSNKKLKIAGTADLVEYYKNRCNIWDYKTNKEISYYSKYNDRFYKPLDHLENCLYNKYALQLSLYAWLLEQDNKEIGQLGIFWIESKYSIKFIPIPYMRYEIEKIVYDKNFDNNYNDWKNKVNERIK